MTNKLIASLPTRSVAERQKMRANAERVLQSADAARRDAAQEFLDALNAFEKSATEADTQALLDMSLKDRIVAAFTREPPTETEAKMIKVLGEEATHVENVSLAQVMGWGIELPLGEGAGGSWNLHFGKMCRRREAFIHPAPSQYKSRGGGSASERHYSALLADLVDADGKGIEYRFKPEAVEAFIELGLLSARARSRADERQTERDAWRKAIRQQVEESIAACMTPTALPEGGQ